ncbi:hypothetical protein BGX29_011522 [Mortierella sp. GBA35]|nr:hypothetical protein BGX29_011522 [Mortierella sp. GBA35]
MEEYLAGLEQTLRQVIFFDTNDQIKEATSALKTKYFAVANCVPALVHIIQTSPQKEIRQLAAVELRKQVSNWWTALELDVRTAVKAKLLEIILNEPESLPRHSTARVIATVGRVEIPANTWSELIAFLFQCSSSSTAGHREVGVYVIYAIFEVTDAFAENLRQLLDLFSRTIVDPESQVVRVTTVQALGKIADFIEDEQKEEIAMFSQLVPHMVNVLQQTLTDGDEESAVKCFDVFDQLLLLEIPVISKHVQFLIEFFLGIGSNKAYDPIVRVQGLSFLMWAVVYKKTKIQRLKLVSPMIQALMPIAAEEEPEDTDEDSPARLAFKVINTLATNLPPQQVFPIAAEGILAYMQNPEPLYRKAAMVTLAVLVEGSVDFIRPKFNELLTLVCTGLRDPEATVRRAACMALSSLAEEFDEEVAENHATLLPLVFNLMSEPTPEITKQACNALDAILEGLGDNILQYLPELMQKLLHMLDNAQGETRAIVVAAIGSAAHASGQEFTPYFAEVTKRLQHLMSLRSNDDEIMLRSVATDALGAIAIAVGKETFRPHLNDLMVLAMEGLHLTNNRLRECCFYFFAGIAQVFADEFAPFLEAIVPQLIHSCQLDENTTRLENDVEDLEELDGEEGEEDSYMYKSAVADEKEVAADTIGELFQFTGSTFLPYVESTVKELLELSTHLADGVRKASCRSLFNFLRAFYKLSNSQEWKAGLPVAVPLHENVAQLNSLVMPAILSVWDEEDEKMVVFQICNEMVETVRLCGPGIIANHIDDIAEKLKLLFEKKAYCQQELEDDEGLLEEDEQAEYDALLITGASDLVGALAAALGASFVPYAQVFIPHIAKYYKKSKPTSERSMAMGCLGEIANGMSTGITDFTEQLFPLIVKGLSDEEEEVRSNAAFAIGALCQNTTIDLSSQYPALLTALYPLFQGQDLSNVTDNACGAVARMIMKYPNVVPVEQVLPVFVQALPLKIDFEENEPVYKLLFSLIRSQNAWIFNNLPQLLAVFADVLPREGELKPATRLEMLEIIKQLNQQFPALNITASPLGALLGKLENRVLAIIINTQAGVEEACVFIIKRTGLMASVLQEVLPVYFDFRISVAQTKPVDKDDKQSIQDSKNDFTLKLFCDQTEATVHTDDLETLQGLLRELRRSHLIAQDDNFYAGGSSHRWIQFYTKDEGAQSAPGSGSIQTMEEFISSTTNPLSMYFLQPEENQAIVPSGGPRLELGTVKETWIEKEMRARESDFTENGFMHAFVGTWNVNGRDATQKLDPWLKVEGEAQPDIYVLCFQELDLSAEAYIVFDGSKEEEWNRAIAESLGNGYRKVMSKQLVGLLIVMYAAVDHTKYIKEVTAHSAGVGIMGVLANKGAVSIRIRYKDSYLCFVGSHLAADTSQVDRRNQDYQEICRRLTFPSSSTYDITKSPAGNAVLAATNKMVSIFDSDHTIWAGDLNYRIGLPEDVVKNHLKTNDYEALLKHDQLVAQRAMYKAFSEFEEHSIDFLPTYKFDVGTSTWDSSEKRRVPSYTDRILWRAKDQAKDSVEPHFYKSHMELTLSDHKPVSAFFKLKVKTLLHDKQAEVHQAIVKELDRYENECMPDATISSSSVVFDKVRYLEPKKTTITIKNTKQFPSRYRFKPKLQDEWFCKPWMWANPPVGMIMPGETVSIELTVLVDNDSAPLLNTGREVMEDILILHLEHGKDYFITVSGSYVRTCFGNSLEWLSRLDRPIRLWNPKEDEEQEADDDDTATLYDLHNALGTKSSMGSMKDSISGTTAREKDDAARHLKNAKSLDSFPEKDSIGRKSSKSSLVGDLKSLQLADEKRSAPVVKKQKPVRQLSLPKDLWRIVDFIYKHGFSVDNLFLLSGDQPTMTYIRECLDTGEEFDLSRLLDKPSQDDEKKAADSQDTTTDASAAPPTSASSALLSSRGSTADLKPQIARPVSIMNGIPPKAATFGLGENRGIHSMAEVLLRFLESLREPVVPTEMYYRALEIANHQQAAYGLLDLMPPVHVNVFVYITSFLRELILIGGSSSGNPSNAGAGSKEGAQGPNSGGAHTNGSIASAGSSSPALGQGGMGGSNHRVMQSSSGSIYNGNDAASVSGRGKHEDNESYRVSKLASVFSSVMLRPPPGAERLSEVEALKRKTFLMQFLQEPADEEGMLSPGGPNGQNGGVSSSSSAAATGDAGHTGAPGAGHS